MTPPPQGATRRGVFVLGKNKKRGEVSVYVQKKDVTPLRSAAARIGCVDDFA
jgi:hypothetical protein